MTTEHATHKHAGAEPATPKEETPTPTPAASFSGAAQFSHGDPIMIPYTPAGAAVAGGQVVVVGTIPMICHRDIAQNALGALAIGGGIYLCKNINNAGNGTKVYWDATNFGVTTTAAGNTTFGCVVEQGAGGANSQCGVFHNPNNGTNP